MGKSRRSIKGTPHRIKERTIADKTIERVFRVVEMTIIMAVLERFVGRVYPEPTSWVVWILGWMTSYYAIEDFFRKIFDAISDSKNINPSSKIFGYFFITIAFSFIIWLAVRPLVLSLANLPLLP